MHKCTAQVPLLNGRGKSGQRLPVTLPTTPLLQMGDEHSKAEGSECMAVELDCLHFPAIK